MLPLWEECASWGDEQYRAFASFAKAAIAAAPDWGSTMDKISEQLTIPDPDTIELLKKLWLHCAIDGCRRCVATVLYRMQAPVADDVLAAEIERYDCTMDAALAILRQEPTTAYDRFESRFSRGTIETPHGKIIANIVLGVLAPIGMRGEHTPVWRDPQVPQWLAAEPRWGTLAKALRKSPVGEVARAVERGRREAGLK